MAASPTPVDFETGATQAPRCTRNRLDQHQPNPPVTGWRSAIAPDLRKRGWYQAGPDRSVELRLRCAPAILVSRYNGCRSATCFVPISVVQHRNMRIPTEVARDSGMISPGIPI